MCVEERKRRGEIGGRGGEKVAVVVFDRGDRTHVSRSSCKRICTCATRASQENCWKCFCSEISRNFFFSLVPRVSLSQYLGDKSPFLRCPPRPTHHIGSIIVHSVVIKSGGSAGGGSPICAGANHRNCQIELIRPKVRARCKNATNFSRMLDFSVMHCGFLFCLCLILSEREGPQSIERSGWG